MSKRLSPVILYESWSEGPDDEEYLRERNFPGGTFGTSGTEWATVYDLTVRETNLGGFSEEIGNIFYVRVCSPGFVDSDDRFKGKWRVEMENFNDGEITRKIIDYVEGTRGILLLKAPVEVPARLRWPPPDSGAASKTSVVIPGHPLGSECHVNHILPDHRTASPRFA